MTIPYKTIELIRKLFSRTVMDDVSGCWSYRGAKIKGYGVFRWNKKDYRLHRFIYIVVYGLIPKDKVICHKCDNRSCWNPKHLFLGTHDDNSKDAVSKNRTARGEKNNKAKLTKEDVLKIRNDNRSNRVVGRAFNVSNAAIWYIRHNKTWGWL